MTTGNPVIDAVDAGHVATGTEPNLTCQLNGKPWPCDEIIAARLLAATRGAVAANSRSPFRYGS